MVEYRASYSAAWGQIWAISLDYGFICRVGEEHFTFGELAVPAYLP